MLSCARAPANVIQLLLQCCPESATVADRSGTFPLHFVSSWGEERDRESSGNTDGHGNGNEEQKAIGSARRHSTTDAAAHSPRAKSAADGISVVTDEVETEHDNANTNNNDDDDDDHDNYSEESEFDLRRVLKLLLDCGPEVLIMQNQWGQTPLHCVFDNDDRIISPRVETIKLLLGLYDYDVDHQDLLPSSSAITHYASDDDDDDDDDDDSEGDKSDSSESGILEGEEDSHTAQAQTPGKKAQASPAAEVKTVREYAQQALSIHDTNSYLPLHLAASIGSSEKILRLLVSKYPKAAMIATTSGDLPVHLMQYYAEDEALDGGSNPFIRQGSWRGGSGIFRLRKNKTMNIVSLGQIECLLQPLCLNSRTQKRRMSRQMLEKATGKAKSKNSLNTSQRSLIASIQCAPGMDMDAEGDEHADDHIDSTDKDAETDNAGGIIPNISMEHDVAINLATRLPGSRSVNLPIHIAAEHGVSYDILSTLCELNSEGVATPQPIAKSMLVSSSSSLDVPEGRYSSPELFPIEAFEKGRAGMEALKACHILKSHNEDPSMNQVKIEFDPGLINVEVLKGIIQNFENRSDLLFAFYPEALPAEFPDTKRNRNAPKPRIRYSRDQSRRWRLEKLIRSEAIDTTTYEFSIIAQRVWTWLYQGINSRDNSISAEYQGAVGRIITGLPEEALLKLSYISHVANDMGIEISEKDMGHLRNVPCRIQGKSIIQYAAARDASIRMNSMILLNEHENRNAIHTICECLDANDALAFSSVCQRTMKAGVRIFPENKLKETGRSWLLPPRQELAGADQAEFWQNMDSMIMIPESTHTIFVTYYLEVSDSSQVSTSNKQGGADAESLPQHMNGGLLVVGENAAGIKKSEARVVGKFQKKRAYSELNYDSVAGYEVQVSFTYRPGNSYTLRVYGPKGGGRISISNARVRQVVYCLDREKRTPLQVLLMNNQKHSHLHSQSPLVDQLSTLLDERYRFTGVATGHILHFALQNRVSSEVLEALIDSNPSLLLDTDDNGRTPLHALFLLSSEESPSLSIVKMLLGTPGENATKLKDKDFKVPLHIAAENGVNNPVLELLVEAYPDGCYRQTKDGDIPVHLLVRSGKATTASVEMLLRPIMDSETICSVKGSQGVELPLHIAAEYNCAYNIIERLLLAYVAAATIPRIRHRSSEEMYTLDIFESNRRKGTSESSISPATKSLNNSADYSMNSASLRTLGEESLMKVVEEAAHQDIHDADFNLRSDLIFVHFPVLPKPYRKEKERIQRLRNMIRREAIECVERRELDGQAQMSDMAQLAWCFFCTYEGHDDPSDHYADEVGNILKSLTIPVVKLLASVANPFSSPPHTILSECATPRCKHLISCRVLFVGRYVFDESQFILHQSDDSFVVAGKDYGAVEAYKRLLTTFKQEETPDIDDLASIDSCSSIVHVLSFTDDTASYFVDFATKIGLDEDFAREEFDSLIANSMVPSNDGNESIVMDQEDKHELTMETFRTFCSAHNVDNKGVRKVAVKFMKHRTQFLREKIARARLDLSKSDWYVFPVIEDYDIDRVEESLSESMDTILPRTSWELAESKDNFFALDLQEMNHLGHDFSSYKYALVLPRGDRDFNDMAIHEELKVWEIRDLLLKVGNAVWELHQRSVIHGNLILSNIVQFGSHVALIDLDSATLMSKKEYGSMLTNKIAGISQRFASGVMPPELIARIDLIEDHNALRAYEKYWKHIQNDAAEMNRITSDDTHEISKNVQILNDEAQALKNSEALQNSIRASLKNLSDSDQVDLSWKERISRALGSNDFNVLPQDLSNCNELNEFRNVWSRMTSNQLLWERIRPRLSADKKYAYVVKYHDDSKTESKSDLELPYDLVDSSEKIDVWAFGMLLYSLSTRSSLFHQTHDGNLQNAEVFAKLHDWSKEDARAIILTTVKDALTQDLLLQLLVPEADRLSSMRAILSHPFFGPSSTAAAQKIIQECTESEDLFPQLNEDFKGPVPKPRHTNLFSTETFCRIVFDRLGEIKVPTCFIVLPYELRWDSRSQLLEPQDHKSLALAEKIGLHLLDIHTITAKLSFWLRVKENLTEQNGKEFKSKIINWIQRARQEESTKIAKEIVSSIKCDQAYEEICVEMLDEEMSISHARAFIRDPMKAAVGLLGESADALLELYPSSQLLYLVDELQGCPSLPVDYTDLTSAVSRDSFYPLHLAKEDGQLRDMFLPVINIAVMIALANNGLDGLAGLLGLRKVPESWTDHRLGLVHRKAPFGRSSIVEFATLQRLVRKQPAGTDSARQFHSHMSQDPISSNDELGQLELFFQHHDQLGDYSDLQRTYEEDESLVFWTRDEDVRAPLQSTPEFIATVKRLEQLQVEITQKKRLEEEVTNLNNRIAELKQKAEEKRLKKRKSKKVRIQFVENRKPLEATSMSSQTESTALRDTQASSGNIHVQVPTSSSERNPLIPSNNDHPRQDDKDEESGVMMM